MLRLRWKYSGICRGTITTVIEDGLQVVPNVHICASSLGRDDLGQPANRALDSEMLLNFDRVALFSVFFSLHHSFIAAVPTANVRPGAKSSGRERISINDGWKFYRSETNPDGLSYQHRPNLPSTANTLELKAWILPSGNGFIKDPANRHQRPTSDPAANATFAQQSFDASSWETVNLPHDWAIKGPFYQGDNVPVTGGMGRLPTFGVGWYRRKLTVTSKDQAKQVYLDIDGAMSYAMVWLNGNLVGGWPYGYNSFRLDLTPYLKEGADNVLAIRLDNPTDSSRWYPGGGLYRNVWLTKVDAVHVAQSGTYVTTRDVSPTSATVDVVVNIESKSNSSQKVDVATGIHVFDATTGQVGDEIADLTRSTISLSGGAGQASGSVKIENPRIWGPYATQQPHLYIAVTRLYRENKTIDKYETRFGIRSVTYDSDIGLVVNGEHVEVQGVNDHHDLGAIGTAFNVRAAERQLEVLRELGCNAVRMSHNPPAPELLELTDRMGFLVFDEIFDMWQRNKTTADFSLIFDDWHEPDLRSFIRRDRNHPSVVVWSVGNEVGEQYTNETGAALAQKLVDIAHEEDPTRPVTASMNYAKPYMDFPHPFDVLSLNYQGEGIRNAPAYSQLSGIATAPQYPVFHAAFPQKMLWSSETAAALSTRGTYIFPVVNGTSAPVNDTSGGNSTSYQVSAYELYSADFGSSPDKVFAAQDQNPFVAGEFVWSGWDYLGEPTPYYATRSSYFGIIDLAGFKKDRFFLYQSRWRPELKMAHILPHWTWPDRVGQVTPVHVLSSGDEAELFVNGKSQGKKTKGEYEYRFRWDEIVYSPGELHVITYNNGIEWASDAVRTVGAASRLHISADRTTIDADGKDLSFISIEVLDADGNIVPEANNEITFTVEGAGELVATDNGDPADFTSFPSNVRKAFSGKALAIVKGSAGQPGPLTVTATAEGLSSSNVVVETH
ncbi:glycoside hydrolase superfamily [Lophiotrema nucula]|uniref:Glycoside hydrolase superfamily n=1 Tax=Lophiotrema nucula TaxID=690887 RepID=A0A6A5ZU19_9PLEO|nr:glycoside hydrolase superfamily [Lophiotrema nucula]